ncbi:L,D-transpeptidase family protein [Pararhizobium sp. BT-229]|uniref:L,D-transpeptidase family protein n=1 Tax=Pararhizobium sp. BT-229 TaxID=2986923 RepID=UPI0021F6E8B1|nr:L,D-transpeptidase family protein [Pararhizobium sp. BT-229]MCV9963124.1 L,D-transpeptidase family protein [Pararhizobium sp. BT-229]
MALLALLLAASGESIAFATERADSVIVFKEARRLQLLQGTKLLREFPIALGGRPVGHKGQEGDQKTPEGYYLLDWRNSSSGYYRSIHISYPAPADIAAATAKGVDPGGMIMIHGQRNYFGWLAYLTQMFDWTDGCIAVTNAQMDEIWGLVPDNTPIEIKP